MLSEISNEELERRLRNHNYDLPPVTPSTRSVLLKKLAQLDKERKQATRNRVLDSKHKRAGLLDCSSGEEDNVSTSSSSVGVRRRISGMKRDSDVVKPPSPTSASHRSTLIGFSEDEDDDEEDEEDEEEDDDSRHEFGVQTSPALDQSSLSMTELNSSPGQRLRFGVDLRNTSTPKTTSVMTPSPPSQSTLRRAIAKNEKAFGSLGEALDTLPHRVSTGKNGNTKSVEVKPVPKDDPLKNRGGFCNSHTVSKLVVAVVILFFLALSYKYSTLRPIVDIRPRLPVCQSLGDTSDLACISPDQVDAIPELYRSLVACLENHQMCPDAERGTGLDLETIKSEMGLISTQGDNESEKLTLLNALVRILEEQPQLGIIVNHAPETELALAQPRLPWSCWLAEKLDSIFYYGSVFLWRIIALALIAIAAYASYRVYVWHKERIRRERQEVFDLVEQVLSLLASHHQANARLGRAYVAINHVRDQLIVPQEREKKRKIWNKVIKYIRESESRIREEVQTICGEENRVWRWIPAELGIPNTSISTATSSPASNTSLFPPASVPPFIVTTTNSPSWQGPAFSALNKNVAAPSFAPTSCLKVRHMFDLKQMIDKYSRNSREWVPQIRDEILQRCSQAQIIHIAVDTESREGIVYIKAKSCDDAFKVFNSLHGQWYSGNLVTVKYMKDEQYHDKFPDSRHKVQPLILKPL